MRKQSCNSVVFGNYQLPQAKMLLALKKHRNKNIVSKQHTYKIKPSGDCIKIVIFTIPATLNKIIDIFERLHLVSFPSHIQLTIN